MKYKTLHKNALGKCMNITQRLQESKIIAVIGRLHTYKFLHFYISQRPNPHL